MGISAKAVLSRYKGFFVDGYTEKYAMPLVHKD